MINKGNIINKGNKPSIVISNVSSNFYLLVYVFTQFFSSTQTGCDRR